MPQLEEEAGYCARCEQQVLIRRVHARLAWQAWRCTVCGEATPPLPVDRPSLILLWRVMLAVLILLLAGWAVLLLTSL